MNTESKKEKIILILKESIRFGREADFLYSPMNEKHKEVLWIHSLTKTMEHKIELFKNLSEESHVFERIFDTAKLALRKLQDDSCYNYYSAELIMKFNQLEDEFKRKLKPLGVRVLDVVYKESQPTDFSKINKSNQDESDEEELIPLTRTAKYVSGNTSGKKFSNQLRKQAEISSLLRETNLD